MLSGLCKGGPCGGRWLHHPEPTYRIGRDILTHRLIVGWHGDHPDVEVGQYKFTNGEWRWWSPNPLDETKAVV